MKCTRRILLTLWLEEFGPRGGSGWAMTPRWPPDGAHLPPLPRGTGWGCERALLLQAEEWDKGVEGTKSQHVAEVIDDGKDMKGAINRTKN